MLETRIATFEDIYNIFVLVEKNYCENNELKTKDFADEKIFSIIKNLIENKQAIILVDNDKIIGGTGYVFCEHLFSYEQYMAEIMMFLEKDHRNFPNFKKLYKALEEAWLLSGVKEFHVGSMNGYRTEDVCKLYEFFGHKKTSVTLKRVVS